MSEFIVSTAYDGKHRKLYWFDCLRCGWTFLAPKHAGRKYCSKQCFDLRDSNKVTVVCDLCQKKFQKKPSSFPNSKHGFYFCSRACKDKAQRLESAFPEIHPPHYGNGEGTYREIAKRHHPWKCNRCGYDELPGILKVHHRDRNRSNNDKENLEVLCPMCHDIEHYLARDGMYRSGTKQWGRGETRDHPAPAPQS